MHANVVFDPDPGIQRERINFISTSCSPCKGEFYAWRKFSRHRYWDTLLMCTRQAQAQLDEDALIMWQAALSNSTTLDDSNSGVTPFELVPLILTLIANNFDILGKTVRIVESYLLLDAPRFLQVSNYQSYSTNESQAQDKFYAVDFFRAVVAAMDHALSVNIKDMTTALQLALQLAPSALWGEALHISGLFAYIVEGLKDSKDSKVCDAANSEQGFLIFNGQIVFHRYTNRICLCARSCRLGGQERVPPTCTSNIHREASQGVRSVAGDSRSMVD